jgi:hypothetical protein
MLCPSDGQTGCDQDGAQGPLQETLRSEDMSVPARLPPDDDHWVMLEKHKQVAQDIRRFIEDKDFPKDSVYRADVR